MIYSHLLKLNTFILIRVIKEMMTMQHAKENQSEQIRWEFCATSFKEQIKHMDWANVFTSFLPPIQIM